jgi:hypothetical protein
MLNMKALSGLVITCSAFSLDQQDRELAGFLNCLKHKILMKTAKCDEIVRFLPFLHDINYKLPIFRNSNVRYILYRI